MSCLPRLLAAGALCLLAAGGVQAATVTGVEIRGLDELMTQNVRVSLSLVDAIGKDVSGRRLGYLCARQRTKPARRCNPSVITRRPSMSNAFAAAKASRPPVAAVITVDLGTPVTVRRSNLAIEGAGGKDKYLRADLAAFRPQAGDPLDHALYEASKTRITRRLAERGYFDADFVSRKVEVTRAEHAADIDLVWTSGERYDMGPTTITQTPRIIREGILERLVYWEEGSYFHQGKLDRLRESLARLDYFASIDIKPTSGGRRRRPRAGQRRADAGQARRLHRRSELRHRQRRRRAPGHGAPLRQRSWPQAAGPDRLGAKSARPRPRSTASPRSRGSMAGTRSARSTTTNRATTSTRARSSWSAAAAARSTTASTPSPPCTPCASAGPTPRTTMAIHPRPCRTATRRFCIRRCAASTSTRTTASSRATASVPRCCCAAAWKASVPTRASCRRGASRAGTAASASATA